MGIRHIDSWFEFVVLTTFFLSCILIGIVGSIVIIFKILRSDRKVDVSWEKLIEKDAPFMQNPLQELLVFTFVFIITSYILFVDEWFFMYIDEVSSFLGL